jgi:hypothetical protein
MLNIKTSDPYDLKPVELTPSELSTITGGLTQQQVKLQQLQQLLQLMLKQQGG